MTASTRAATTTARRTPDGHFYGHHASREWAVARPFRIMYPPVRQFESRQLELEQRLGIEPRMRRQPQPAGAPPRYKVALLTWAAAYAVITLVLAVLGSTMAAWPLAVRTLVLSLTMVVTLTWLVMPRLTRVFATWLHAGA